MFTYNYETRYGDYKNFDIIKPGAVLDIIQDVAIRDSASLGYGIDGLKRLNMAWLLQGLNVSFVKPVKTLPPVEASTGVKRMKGATSERCSILKQENEIAVKAVANWFIFNTEKKRVGKIPPEMLEAYKCHSFEDDFFHYRKLQPRDIEKTDYVVRVSNSDIDTNMHLNNQKGADLLMNALPYDFSFNNINILYKRPAYLGEELEVSVMELENGFYVQLRTKEKEVSVAGEFTI